ncbi:hypothetical protein ScPMuIL_003434 [Solemya velum]
MNETHFMKALILASMVLFGLTSGFLWQNQNEEYKGSKNLGKTLILLNTLAKIESQSADDSTEQSVAEEPYKESDIVQPNEEDYGRFADKKTTLTLQNILKKLQSLTENHMEKDSSPEYLTEVDESDELKENAKRSKEVSWIKKRGRGDFGIHVPWEELCRYAGIRSCRSFRK